MTRLPDSLGLLSNSFSVLNALTSPVWIFDIDESRIYWANPPALDIWNAESLTALQDRDMAADMSHAVTRRLQQYQQDFERNQARFTEIWTLYPKGVAKTFKVFFSGIRLEDGRVAMLCEVESEYRGDPETLRSVEALLHTNTMISLYSPDGDVLYQNPAARASFPLNLIPYPYGFAAQEDYLRLKSTMDLHGFCQQTALMMTNHGKRWHEISARVCHDPVTGEQAILVSELDVSDLKMAEGKASYLAEHDILTGLPNRNYVLQHFEKQLQVLLSHGQEAALIFIDLDHFKQVNDSLGHTVGDMLLVQMASRLTDLMNPGDMLARLGGDEFVVLSTARHIETHAKSLCETLLERLSDPLVVSGSLIHPTLSIGVSLAPKDAKDINHLMRNADLAMYRAKDEGRNRYAFFTRDLTEAIQSRHVLENELKHALVNDQFEVFFQPRINAKNGCITGAEALVRWRHPERGIIAPGVFITLCEDCGIIDQLDMFVLHEAIRYQKIWLSQGWHLKISVNLSPRQFANPELAEDICAMFTELSANPADFELEITESALLGNDHKTIQMLTRLQDSGFSIAIDDFGTGYSNLAYLRRYPIDCMKIDKSFVQKLDEFEAITGLIVALAKVMNLKIVVEGVETEAQLAWLKEQGCHEYQGYLFSPPVPPELFASYRDRQEFRSMDRTE
nr:EAL domain-containing protein [Leeia oryzae]